MKKSQIAAALALTYVAGVSLPLATVANAAGGEAYYRDCTSATAAAAAKYTGAENLALISRIEATEDYQGYLNLVGLKNSYDGQQYDKIAADAKATVGDNNGGATKAANGTASTLSSKLSGVAAKVDALAQTTLNTASPAATAEAVVGAIEGEIKGYAQFTALYEASTTKKASQTDTSIGNLLKAYNDATYDNAKITTDKTAVDDIASVVTTKDNTANPKFDEYKAFYDLVQAYYAHLPNATALANATTAMNNAVDTQKAQVKVILDAVNAYEGGTPLAWTDSTLDTVALALGKITAGTKFTKYDALAGKLANTKSLISTGDNDKLHTDIINALIPAGITDAAIVEALTNPKANYTITCSNTAVSVTSNKPMYTEGLNVIATKLDDIKNGFTRNKAQAIYDIKLSYRGNDSYAANAVAGTDYTVTIALPANMASEGAEVYLVEGSSWTPVSGAKVVNGKMTFTTPHFSTYALVGDVKTVTSNPNDPAPGTTVNPKPTTKTATVKSPNTGLNANVASIARANANGATSEQTAITVSAIAALCAMAVTVVAAVRRFAKRNA